MAGLGFPAIRCAADELALSYSGIALLLLQSMIAFHFTRRSTLRSYNHKISRAFSLDMHIMICGHKEGHDAKSTFNAPQC